MQNQVDLLRDIYVLFLETTAEQPVQLPTYTRGLFQNRKAVICGDLNFHSLSWGAYWSTDKEEQDVLNILEERVLRQAIDFPTCGKNFPDELFYKNCEVFSQIDNSFNALYYCSNNCSVLLSLEIDYQQ